MKNWKNKTKVDYLDTTVDFLDRTIRQISNRTFTIKTLLSGRDLLQVLFNVFRI